jgi:hypothetical protein
VADDFDIEKAAGAPVPGTLRARESHNPFFNVKNFEKDVHITAIRNSSITTNIANSNVLRYPEIRREE